MGVTGSASEIDSLGSGRPDPVDLSVAQWATEWPDLDVSAMEVFGRLHRIFLQYHAQITRVMGKHGVNAASFGVLAALYRSGPPYRLKVSQLADQTLVSTGGMTQRLDRLEAAGLITRARTDQDRRVVHAQLTYQGQERARTVAEAHFANETGMLKLLNPAQREAIVEGLRTLEQSVMESRQS